MARSIRGACRSVAAASLALCVALTVACTTATDSAGGWSAEALAKSRPGVSVVVINSQPVVGPTRLAFGLIGDDGSLLQDATGSVRLFHLTNDQASAAGEQPLAAVSLLEAPDHTHAAGTPAEHNHDPLATMYIAQVDLDRGEWWGAELAVKADGKEYKSLRARFFVAAQSPVPAIGATVPKSTQLVLRDVKDVAEIDSSIPPRPDLHTMTIAEAVVSGKPTLIAFATPAFCQTRFCGPVVDSVVAPLSKEYAGRANFIHVEPYVLADARKGKLVPIKEMAEWGLASEPYLFVLDSQGRVAAQFEGITEHDEVARALERVLAAPATSVTPTRGPS